MPAIYRISAITRTWQLWCIATWGDPHHGL